MSQTIREAKKKEREDKQAGSGRMVFRNVSHATISLPKPSFDTPPRQIIEPGGLFTGDSYHQEAMASTGTIRLLEVREDSAETQAASRAPELVNVYDPLTGKTVKMTPEQLAESKKKKGSSKKEESLDAVR